MDPAQLFVLSPQAGLRALAARDASGFMQSAMPVLSQYVALNEPYDPAFADTGVQDLALLTSVPSLSRTAFGPGGGGALDGLAQLLANVQDPLLEALFEGQESDSLEVANPVDRVMAYLNEGNVQRLPH